MKLAFLTKDNSRADLIRHRSQPVERGDLKEFMWGFADTFAPVTELPIVKLLILNCSKRTMFEKLDLKSAHIHGLINRGIFVRFDERSPCPEA